MRKIDLWKVVKIGVRGQKGMAGEGQGAAEGLEGEDGVVVGTEEGAAMPGEAELKPTMISMNFA